VSIKYAMLGFLSWMPSTGYDLKKRFEESLTLHWSGNNNQIYKALVELHDEGLVTLEVQQQADKPPRKIYTITDKGIGALKRWVLTAPELPQLRNTFLVQLAWADQLSAAELDALVAQYEDEVQVHLLMFREQKQRGKNAPQRTARETYLWGMISDRWISFYETELNWVRQLRQDLSTFNS
jgi:PadR family transcriptional regulator, regulatory protein AphA